MKKNYANPIAVIVAVTMIYYGFKLATQAGQPWPVFQNDGYAGSGGVMILIGGILLGWLIGKQKKK
jgi:hypothetical protein